MAYVIVSAEVFKSLRESDDPGEYRLAATGIATCEVWMDILARYPSLTEWVVHNKAVPIEILQFLADHEDERVRHDVACKRKLSAELFDKLSLDPSSSVRVAIAYNPNCPTFILQRLSTDEDIDVRMAVSSRTPG